MSATDRLHPSGRVSLLMPATWGVQVAAFLPGMAVAKRRRFYLLASSALASWLLGMSGRALAQCSPPVPIVGIATCTGVFTNNIVAIDSKPLTLNNVTVTSPGGAAVVVGSTNVDISIVGDGVIIDNSTEVSGILGANTGLQVSSKGSGAAITTNNTTSKVTGPGGDWAINAASLFDASSGQHDVFLDYKQGAGLGLSSGQVGSPGGNEEGAIIADNHGTGSATIDATGAVNVVNNGPNFAYGILAHAGDTDFGDHAAGAGNASVHYRGGTINVDQQNPAPGGLPGPRGILAWIDGLGSASVTTDAGTTIKVSDTQFGGPGVFLFSSDPTADTNTLTANVASTIESVGPELSPAGSGTRPVGIRANNSGSKAPISITYTGPGITTQGSNGIGILAQSGGGSIDIGASGPITTNGYGAHGVVAGLGGLVQITAANVTTKGEFSTGINAKADGNVTVNVAPGGSVMGGWQADLDSAGVSWFSLPSAGRWHPEFDRGRGDPEQ